MIIGEPTSREICVSTLGFHHFRIGIYGKRAHMATVDDSSSAVERSLEWLTRLKEVQNILKNAIVSSSGYSDYCANPLNIGIISGGNDAAVPPVECHMEGVAFSAPGMSRADLEDLMRTSLFGTKAEEDKLIIGDMSFSGNLASENQSTSRPRWHSL